MFWSSQNRLLFDFSFCFVDQIFPGSPFSSNVCAERFWAGSEDAPQCTSSTRALWLCETLVGREPLCWEL